MYKFRNVVSGRSVCGGVLPFMASCSGKPRVARELYFSVLGGLALQVLRDQGSGAE